MVYAEATIAMPIISGYGYHKGSWKNRKARCYSDFLNKQLVKA
jgi:deoxyhypusine synthase